MVEYGVYSDESGGPGERTHALAAVSGRREDLERLRADLDAHASLRGIRDLKWTAVRKRKPRLEAAQAYLDTARKAAARRKVRLDVLVWRGRHEPLLKRMYTLLLSKAAQGTRSKAWAFCPDQRTGVRWEEVVEGLRPFHRIEPQRSSENSLIQLADLVAGMARFCNERATDFRRWQEGRGKRLKATENRFMIAREFFDECRRDDLPVYFWEP